MDMEQMMMIDVLCERGDTVARLITALKDTSPDSPEHTYGLKYLKLLTDETIKSYYKAQEEEERAAKFTKPTRVH